jgi:hypothetical protein
MGIMAGGGETTREDMIIYGPCSLHIDWALGKLGKNEAQFPRSVLEALVYRCILEVEENGPW